MTEQLISTEVRGHLHLIGLARPAKRNAFTTGMLAQLAAAFTAFEADAEARVAVLFAHGDHFTGGLDLAEVGPAVARGASLASAGGTDPLDLWGERRKKPVVCAVQGICFTVGIEMMLAGDIVVAADDCRFCQMEAKRGIAPRVELNEPVGFEPYLEMGVKHFNVGIDVKSYFRWLQQTGSIMRRELGLEPISEPGALSSPKSRASGYGQ